ncbi:hypothetical protein [Glycomyces albidus]|uniref:hypothetical protein n=1 Tax=Glycomyces albidus TaxID=2656774 RepID=UPI001883CF8E|nr:hypothetical protein [Glycomyces albidus]
MGPPHEIDPSNPPSTEGCIHTTEGAIATITLNSAGWNGDHAEGEADVTVWHRVE